MHEVITDLVPRDRHWTPALRPGVQHLFVARSGRRASLRFQGIGEMRALARGGCYLVQRAAAAASGLNWKANEILVAPRETQVHAAVPANAEQLFTARAAPFWVQRGGFRLYATSPVHFSWLAGSIGSRHWIAPLLSEPFQ